MATTNKALTTYLPTESVEWLEGYCLDYKHLLNKDGNPKLGTALADIISRLADGELSLPVKIEPMSTVIDNAQYGTEISTLKSEVESLKKLLAEYGTSKLPDTVLDLDEVSTMINTAIHKASIGNNDTHGNTLRIDVLTAGSTEVQRELAEINSAIGEVEAYAKSQLATMREELAQLKKPLAIVR